MGPRTSTTNNRLPCAAAVGLALVLLGGWAPPAAAQAAGRNAQGSAPPQAAPARSARPPARAHRTPKAATKPQARPRATRPAPQVRGSAPARPPGTAAPRTLPASRTAVATASTDVTSRITRPGEHRFSFPHGGRARAYRVKVPVAYHPAVPAPVLVVLGGTAAAQDAGALQRLAAQATQEGFVTVFPAPGDAAPQAGDAGFAGQVVTHVFRQLSIDRERIYVAGAGEGAAQALQLPCALPSVFAAVVALGGEAAAPQCEGGDPVSVLHVQARARGAAAGTTGGAAAPWARFNACAPAPRRMLDVGEDHCEAWSFCRGLAQVEQCRIEAAPVPAIAPHQVAWSFLARHAGAVQAQEQLAARR